MSNINERAHFTPFSKHCSPHELRFQCHLRLQNLFWQMDGDHSGSLTADEMQELVKDPQMAAYFTGLGHSKWML